MKVRRARGWRGCAGTCRAGGMMQRPEARARTPATSHSTLPRPSHTNDQPYLDTCAQPTHPDTSTTQQPSAFNTRATPGSFPRSPWADSSKVKPGYQHHLALISQISVDEYSGRERRRCLISTWEFDLLANLGSVSHSSTRLRVPGGPAVSTTDTTRTPPAE